MGEKIITLEVRDQKKEGKIHPVLSTLDDLRSTKSNSGAAPPRINSKTWVFWPHTLQQHFSKLCVGTH